MSKRERKDFQKKESTTERERKDFAGQGEITEETTQERLIMEAAESSVAPPQDTGTDALKMKWTDGVIDRIVGSRKISTKGRSYHSAKLKLRECVEVLVYAIAFALIIRGFFFESFKIPSMSMGPTLLNGDYVFASKLSYGFKIPWFETVYGAKPPQYADVIVFLHKDQYHVKRIVGLPGDTIVVKNGRIVRNTHPVELTANDDQPFRETGMVVYTETLEGKNYPVMLPSSGDVRSSEKLSVSDGHVFVLGDHRMASEDSRAYGQIPISSIVGRAAFVWLSIQKEPHFSIRWDHMGWVDKDR